MLGTHSRLARLAASAAVLALGATPVVLTGSADAEPSGRPQTLAGTVTPAEAAEPARAAKPFRLELLALNDFHGQLEKVPATSSSGRIGTTEAPSGVPAGGAAYLATHLKQLRAEARERGARTLTVAAGDLIGATPLLSAAFHDEPTVEAMNRMRLDLVSVGNHEFDEGYRELLRMQRGGCLDDGDGADNQNSCPDPLRPFAGADYRYLAANVRYADSGRTVFPGYRIERYGRNGRIKVAFIGMTLQDTPNIVTAAGIQGLRFTDEVRTVRRLMPELRSQGVKSIVVLLHQGGVGSDPLDYDGCMGVTGPGVDIARRLPRAVDVVVSGHTHQAYNCSVEDPAGKPRLLTSASSLGRLVTDIRLEIDRRTRDVIRPRAEAENVIVTNADGTLENLAILRLIDRYRTLVEPIANEVLGQLAGVSSLPKPTGDALNDDFALGNLIADSQLADDSTVPEGGVAPVIAFMNPGGIRADLVENSAGDVTYGTAFSVQPFNNYLTSQTLTGEQVIAVLNQQWNGANEGAVRILQVAGLRYTWDRSLAAQPDTDALIGPVLVDEDGDPSTEPTPIDPATEYRVVQNSFLLGGGDGFPTLAEGTDPFFGGLDIDALADYLGAHSPYQATPSDRITVVD